MDTLSFENHLAFDVNHNKDERDPKKTYGYVEWIDTWEHRKDFSNVKSPEDVE